MSRLTALERRALHLASAKAGAEVVKARRSDDNRKAVTTAIANRLTLKGYARVVEGRLRVTHDGQRALNAVLPPAAAVFLHKRDGLTTRLDLAVRDEPEWMDGDEVHRDWRDRAEAHRKLARADSDAARLSGLAHPEERLAELRRMAAERGQDIRGDLRQLEHVVRRIERKVTEEAA